jgi:hypothetical protein
VTLSGGRSAFHPEANLTQPWGYDVATPDLPAVTGSDLVINELQADNVTTIADEAGEYDDWLELYNRGAGTVSLSGLFLGPSARDPWRYALPDARLRPGERLVVWCDRDPEQGPNHADFKLGRGGDEVRLSSHDATLDVATFAAMAADVSLARLPDGADGWWTCDSPSPGEANWCGSGPRPSPTSSPPPTAPAATTTAESSPTAPATTPSTPPTPGNARAVFLPSLQR